MDSFIKLAPTIATLFFFIAFCYIAVIALKKSNKKRFEEYSQIPLQSEKNEQE